MNCRSLVVGCLAFSIAGIAIACMVFSLLLFHVYSTFDGDAVFPVDCAIVFGASVHRGSIPGPGIRRRVSMAAYLYNQEDVGKLFLSGGKGDDQHASEADVMRSLAVELGVDPDDIVVEGASRSTWENLANTMPLTGECGGSIVGISDRYHLARIRFLAEQQGWEGLRVHPAGESTPLFELRSSIREALGIAYYGLFY